MAALPGQQGRTSQPWPIPPPVPSQGQDRRGGQLEEAPVLSIKHLPGDENRPSPDWNISLWVGGQDQAQWGNPGWDRHSLRWQDRAMVWCWAGPQTQQQDTLVWGGSYSPAIYSSHRYYIWTHIYVQSIHHNIFHMHIWCINTHTERGTLIESIKRSLCNTQVLLIVNHRRLISFYLKSKIPSLLYSNRYTGIISQSPWIFIPKIWQDNNCMTLTHVRGFG